MSVSKPTSAFTGHPVSLSDCAYAMRDWIRSLASTNNELWIREFYGGGGGYVNSIWLHVYIKHYIEAKFENHNRPVNSINYDHITDGHLSGIARIRIMISSTSVSLGVYTNLYGHSESNPASIEFTDPHLLDKVNNKFHEHLQWIHDRYSTDPVK